MADGSGRNSPLELSCSAICTETIEITLLPSEAEVRAAFHEGKEAVVKLFFDTLGRLAERHAKPGRPTGKEQSQQR